MCVAKDASSGNVNSQQMQWNDPAVDDVDVFDEHEVDDDPEVDAEDSADPRQALDESFRRFLGFLAVMS